MRQSRFNEEQIIGILREQEAGRRRRMSAASTESAARPFPSGRAGTGGMEVSEARRLKLLSDENAKLKKLLADGMLDIAILKEPKKIGDARRGAASRGPSLPVL